MRRILLTCAVVTAFVPAVAARAGVMTSEPGSCSPLGGCSGALITYNAVGDPSSRITARSVGEGLLLADTNGRIRLRGRAAGECSLHGQHSAACPYVSAVTVHADNRGDVIDARRFTAYTVLQGGAGNDELYAPRRRLSTLIGGPGHNVLVGGREAAVSYEQAPGPVRVDLARGVGATRDETDRLVGVREINGSERYANRLLGGPRGGTQLLGGRARNYLLARGPSFVTIANGVNRPSTVVCQRGRSRVEHVEARDTLLGTCDVGQVHLLGAMRTVGSPFLSAEHHGDYEQGIRIDRVTVVAVPSGAVVGEVVEPEHGAYSAADCRPTRGDRRCYVA
jgi:hypothetical protein